MNNPCVFGYNAAMYDEFSEDYDRFVNWAARLAGELPWLEQQLQQVSARRVLDAACGTGQHAIALAQRGYQAAGADLSPAMIARARDHAAAAGQTVDFKAVGFGALASAFGTAEFEAVLCLGNSLPHLLTASDLQQALEDFRAVLRPGGLLVLQNRNFDLVMAQRARWMEPQSHRQGEKEWIFLRFYDFDPDGLITFNMVTLRRMAEDREWEQRVSATRLRPLLQAELQQALTAGGFIALRWYGNMAGAPFDPAGSGNLVVTARRG